MARLTDGKSQMMIATKMGKVMRCPEDEFRDMGRGAMGVKGVTLQGEEDCVINMLCVDSDKYDILVVSENGYGKRSPLDQYRITHRGGKGVATLNVTEKTGRVVAICNVTDDNDLMIINRSGITIRMHVSDLRVLGRNTQGVRLINLKGKDSIASITAVDADPDEEVAEVDGTELPPDENVNPEDQQTEESAPEGQTGEDAQKK